MAVCFPQVLDYNSNYALFLLIASVPLLLPICCFVRVCTQWEENLNLTHEVLGIQSSDSLQRILGLDHCELALSVCPLRGHNRLCSCLGFSRVLLHIHVRLQLCELSVCYKDFSLYSKQFCWFCVLICEFSFWKRWLQDFELWDYKSKLSYSV